MPKPKISEISSKPATSRLSARLKTRAIELLCADIAACDQHLTGDIWGYVIDLDTGDDLPGNGEWSCWDIYGIEDASSEVMRNSIVPPRSSRSWPPRAKSRSNFMPSEGIEPPLGSSSSLNSS